MSEPAWRLLHLSNNIIVRKNMKKTLLVSMPFGALDRPALGISLLKANLHQHGYDCDIHYLTFAFAEHIGFETYQWLMYDLPYTAFVGDWLFTSALYGDRVTTDRQYIEEILQQTWHLSDRDIQRLLTCRTYIPQFMEYALQSVPWDQYAIIGFTSTFEQNIASLALAQRVKQIYPDLKIVFGGANWEGEMGLELHTQFKFIDYSCSGEGDVTLPQLVGHILGDKVVDTSPPGVVYRAADGRSIFTGGTEPIRDLDTLPTPDFVDYFESLQQSTVGAQVMPTLLMETSRGCWWGAKSHCTFCGLNGNSLTFRSKSPARAIEEMFQLVDRWQIELVEVVDNILDMGYFQTLLPELARTNRHLHIFYEVKANLSRTQLELLKRAGVYRIQPGIESMNNHILTLMQKGTTALHNIQLLKWCKEYGIGADWNLLYGFPSETQQDYDEMLELLPAIRFLNAPSGCGPIRLDRFSPYFDRPEQYGLTNIRSMAPYKYLYPFIEDSLKRIAYYCDFDYAAHVDPTGYATAVIAYIQDWQKHPEPGTLMAIEQSRDILILRDTRSTAQISEVKLAGLEKCVYQYCDRVHSFSSIIRHLYNQFPDNHFLELDLQSFLDSLVANHLMVKDCDQYLSLALNLAPISQAFEHNKTDQPIEFQAV
jgi:ribosomal peptide maturation radical SAM protein 1